MGGSGWANQMLGNEFVDIQRPINRLVASVVNGCGKRFRGSRPFRVKVERSRVSLLLNFL